MRVERSIKNIFYGEIQQIANVLLNIVTRMVLVRTLGLSAVSLNGLFTEVIAMLSLAELGVGSAITYNLYKPLAKNDEEKLSQLMNLFKKAYRAIAIFIAVVGVSLTPFIHLLINKADFDMGYLRLIYLLFLTKTVSSYLFSYKATLLNADQKLYMVTTVNLIFRIITVIVNILLLVITHNFVIYLSSGVVMNLMNNIAISAIAEKQYPFLKKKGELPKEEKRQVFSNIRHLFIGNLSGKITNSTDNILISVLVGTLQVGLYSNYSMIMNNVKNVLYQIQTSIAGSMGNMVVTETKERCHLILCRLTFIMYSLAVFCGACIFCMSTPFVELLFGAQYKMTDILVLSFTINFFYYIVKEPMWGIMKVTGLFSIDKYISIGGSTINLIVSIILGVRWGILGIMLGTTCTLLFQLFGKTIVLYKKFFELNMWLYIRMLIKMSAVAIVDFILCRIICNRIVINLSFFQFIVNGCIASVITVGINYFAYRNTPEFQYCVGLLKEMVEKRRKRH